MRQHELNMERSGGNVAHEQVHDGAPPAPRPDEDSNVPTPVEHDSNPFEGVAPNCTFFPASTPDSAFDEVEVCEAVKVELRYQHHRVESIMLKGDKGFGSAVEPEGKLVIG
jgi:hypothetical protein